MQFHISCGPRHHLPLGAFSTFDVESLGCLLADQSRWWGHDIVIEDMKGEQQIASNMERPYDVGSLGHGSSYVALSISL